MLFEVCAISRAYLFYIKPLLTGVIVARLALFGCVLSTGLVMVQYSHAKDVGNTLGEGVLAFVASRYDKDAVMRVEGWGRLIVEDRSNTGLSDLNKMNHANDYFNQVKWLSDFQHWGQEDYWATPIETLATNGGDCEDYSIGKYFSLLKTHVANDKLRITYVKSLTYNMAHMVLAYYETPSAEPLILDNINGSILPASQRPDLLPIYSFNGESIWLAKPGDSGYKVNSTKSLPQWQQLNSRMKKEILRIK